MADIFTRDYFDLVKNRRREQLAQQAQAQAAMQSALGMGLQVLGSKRADRRLGNEEEATKMNRAMTGLKAMGLPGAAGMVATDPSLAGRLTPEVIGNVSRPGAMAVESGEDYPGNVPKSDTMPLTGYPIDTTEGALLAGQEAMQAAPEPVDPQLERIQKRHELAVVLAEREAELQQEELKARAAGDIAKAEKIAQSREVLAKLQHQYRMEEIKANTRGRTAAARAGKLTPMEIAEQQAARNLVALPPKPGDLATVSPSAAEQFGRQTDPVPRVQAGLDAARRMFGGRTKKTPADVVRQVRQEHPDWSRDQVKSEALRRLGR